MSVQTGNESWVP